MQQLNIVHKKVKSNNQKTVNETKQQQEQELEVENKREGKGRILALSHSVCRFMNSDVFYVESEKSNDLYYFVEYNPSVIEFCACPDNSRRGQFCKHLYAVIYAIMKGTLKDIEHLPKEAKRYPTTIVTKSYRDEDYDF